MWNNFNMIICKTLLVKYALKGIFQNQIHSVMNLLWCPLCFPLSHPPALSLSHLPSPLFSFLSPLLFSSFSSWDCVRYRRKRTEGQDVMDESFNGVKEWESYRTWEILEIKREYPTLITCCVLRLRHHCLQSPCLSILWAKTEIFIYPYMFKCESVQSVS